MEFSREKIKIQYQTLRKSHWLPIGFFFCGFIFDMFMVERIDEPKQIIQLILYSLVLTGLLHFRILEEYKAWVCSARWKKLWKYQEFLTQFLLGTLLNLYSLFYFKSASLGTALLFILIIGSLIFANEFVKLEEHQIFLILCLYFICIASLWIALVPTILGFIGLMPFLLSLGVTSTWMYYFFRLLQKKLPAESVDSFKKKVSRTGRGVVLFFLVFYLFQWIPPVPLAIQYMGVFHDLKKESGEYVLSYSRPWWRFWQNGDQTFLARPGDKVVAFASVFAPRHFHDQLNVRWMLKTNNGWQKLDLIPITVAGGREEGFRGYTTKSNYQPGTYRVQVETTDGREIGRIGLEIETDTSNEPREFKTVSK